MKRNTQPITQACTNGFFNLFLALILCGFFLGACSNSSSDPKDPGSTACPADLQAAQGTACSEQDLVCADPCPSDCATCFYLTCNESGTWEGAMIRGHSDPSCFDAGSLDTTDPVACVVNEGQCLSSDECTQNDAYCGPPGTDAGCGACFAGPDACSADTDCKTEGDHYICEPEQCACGDPSGDGNQCVAGCQDDTECGSWQTCESGRCNATTCETDTDCPANFSCTENQCARLACGDGAECQGCCVLGKCYALPGSCLLPAA